MSNELNENMDLIQLNVSNYLKPLGFKKQRRTYNRWTQDGLCHVINLQMGRYEFGRSNPLCPNLYGLFTVNLGIFVPEVYKENWGREPPKFISEPDCAIRVRIAELLHEEDLWWNISPYPEQVATEIINLIHSYGFPFLERFSDRKSIIESLIPFVNTHKNMLCRPKLDIALILYHMGRYEHASDMFNQHLNESHNPRHIKYLEQLAVKYDWNTPE